MPPRARWILPSLLLLAAPARPEIIERVVVKVNGEILTLSEFTTRQVGAAQQARIPPQEVEEFLRQNNARILEEAVEELLLVQRAGEIGIQLRDAYVDSVISDIKKENGIQNDEDLKRQLRQEGMTIYDLRRNILRSVLRREVLSQELEPRAAVSDAAVHEEYEARKAAEYTTPASVTLQEIVVADAGLAADLVARARAGDDFSELARRNSIGPTAESGGDLGRVALADLSPAVAAVVAGLEPGGVSEAFPVAGEQRVLRLVLRSEAQVAPFEAVREALGLSLRQSRRAEAYARYVAELRSKAVIDYRVREVPVAVDVDGARVAPGPSDPVAPPAGEAPEFEGLEAAPGSGPERVAPVELPGQLPAPTPEPTPEP